MKYALIAAIGLLMLGSCMSHKYVTPSSTTLDLRSVNEIGEDYFEFALQRDPFYATAIGDHRYDDRLPDLSPARRKNDYERLQSFQAQLAALNPQTMKDSDLVRYDLLSHEVDTLIGTLVCKFPLWIVDQLEGPHIALMELSKNHALREPKDLHNLIARFRQTDTFLLDHIANLREGRERGLTAAKITIAHVIEQLEHELDKDPKLSSFMVSQQNLPKTLTSKQKAGFLTDLLNTIHGTVYPALRAYRDYLKYELLPDARVSIGLHALRDGNACYQKLIERHTGLKKSPRDIHNEGLREVQRIKEEMRALIRNSTDLVDERAFMDALHKNPRQFLSSADELIAHNQELVKRATLALPRAFGNLPKTPIEVVPLEDFRQKHAPVAYYFEAPSDGTRPAYYYLNTYQPEKRPLYSMAALAFHEAVPGHHLQIALANENAQIPRFQRHLGQTAFVEGWALYAELLARELELYQSVEEIFGSLNYELWRALRLVVDTGIHFHCWSREKAVHYLTDNSALTENEINNEVDRYIVWPAQALAYKIGQMEFLGLRQLCEDQFKDQFSLSAFHDQMLKHGAVPMATLRRSTMRWLRSQTKVSLQ